MLTETVELTLGHVGLGELREAALLALFGTAQAHLLTQGTGHSLRDVTDADGARLYPGYLWLQLRVPPARRLERHRLWDRVSIGVDVKRYGGLILDSTYVLTPAGEVPDAVEQWDLDQLVSMRATSTWVIDGTTGEPRPSAPKQGAIASLPTLTETPAAIARFRAVRASGTLSSRTGRWATREPIAYPVRLGRDVAQNHNLMFATYVDIMEVATQQLLGEQAWPSFPSALLQHRTTLEREVFFLGHAGVDGRVRADVRAELSPCEPNYHGSDNDLVSAGVLDVSCELYDESRRELLTVARARQLFLIPRRRATLIGDLTRFMAAT